MNVLREIITSPWFYWTFTIVVVVLLVGGLRSGVVFFEAFPFAVWNGFIYAFLISGMHRLWTRMRR